MKILIIEDEERSYMRLKRLLQQIDETFEIDGPITSVSETVAILGDANQEYDIIFADIRLDDGDVFEAFLQVSVQALRSPEDLSPEVEVIVSKEKASQLKEWIDK